jgi:pSer/pThr/pTyr-binding forkhead associated (FHA) protein
MDPNSLSPSASDPGAQPPVLGHLVLLNGRLRGTRRALTAPLTLIGRDPVCEICLHLADVNPIHCAIVHAPGGFWVRDLGGPTGILLNGEPVNSRGEDAAPGDSSHSLVHGDVIEIGPFRFRLELAAGDEAVESPLNPAILQAERDALRIQAAAVVAQQASLTEEESQLQQNRKALQRQKEQLAAHLEERRRHLLTFQEQTRQDRAALKAETEAARQQHEQLRLALTRELEAGQNEHQRAQKERRRLVELRKRLKQRWQRHWQVHEVALQRRQEEVEAERARLRQEEEHLQRERAQLTQAQLRFNGEVEVGRRQLREEWQQLGLAQQSWEAALNQEQADRVRRQRELEQRLTAVTAAERALAEQQKSVEQVQARLRKETEGLEKRIRNQRLKLVQQEQQLAELARANPPSHPAAGAAVVAAPMASTPAWKHPRIDPPAVLLQLAGELADQRRHLLEQWCAFLEVCAAWDPERKAILAQMEVAAEQLNQRGQRLLAQEEALANGLADLRQRQDSLFEIRCSLEAWQTRLRTKETALESERVLLVHEVQAREERAEAAAQKLEEVRQRRMQERSQEIEEVRLARARYAEMRGDYARLWQECQERRAELVREQREFAIKVLALEQYRQEFLSRSTDRPGAEKRLERLERRNKARIEAEERDLAGERTVLMDETRRLEERARHLLQQEEAVNARHEDWARKQTELEDQQMSRSALEKRRQHELRHFQLLHEQDQRQLAELREEVERIARLLLDEGDTPPLAVSQAA